MKEKIFELLKLNNIDFRVGFHDFYNYLIYNLNDRIIINCKIYHDKFLQPYYSLQIKYLFEDTDKFEYNCFSCDKEKCVLFFENIMNLLGVFVIMINNIFVYLSNALYPLNIVDSCCLFVICEKILKIFIFLAKKFMKGV